MLSDRSSIQYYHGHLVPLCSHEKQKILVPFCVESALSGVMQRVEPGTELVRGYLDISALSTLFTIIYQYLTSKISIIYK